MSSLQPIPDGVYTIKYGPNHDIGGEYITGGGPGKILSIQSLGADWQEFNVAYDDEHKGYTFRQFSNPGHPGISYVVPAPGQILRIDRATYFRVVPVGDALYRLVVKGEAPFDELGVVVERSESPPLLSLSGASDPPVWQFEHVEKAEA